MPDSPDYYKYRLYSNRHVLDDLSELAVRLGSPIAGDRLGDVVWFTQMNEGIAPFEYDLSGIGADLNITSHNSEYGGYSLTLTAGSDDNRSVTLNHDSNSYEDGKHGFEVHLAALTEFDFIGFQIIRYDGTNQIMGGIRLSDTDSEYQYINGSGNYVKFDDMLEIDSTDVIWGRFKMVVDFAENQYVSFVHGNQVFNLQNIPVYISADSRIARTRVKVAFKGRASNNDKVLLDLLILTVNEPI